MVATKLSDAEKERFDRLRQGMKPADYLRVLINREASRSSALPPEFGHPRAKTWQVGLTLDTPDTP